MRRRFSYANVAATLALVLSMSGGALAANHYLINSTKQINPKVLKKLKGATGKAGAAGSAGASGAAGAAGKDGAPGKEGKAGPSNGYQAFNDSPGTLKASMGSLSVPAGSYLVSAKLWVINTSSERQRAACELVNSVTGDRDESAVTLEPIGTTAWFGRTMLTLQAAATLPSAGSWSVNCVAATLDGNNLKIQATQVGSLSNTNA
jgi:hypothetical protein